MGDGRWGGCAYKGLAQSKAKRLSPLRLEWLESEALVAWLLAPFAVWTLDILLATWAFLVLAARRVVASGLRLLMLAIGLVWLLIGHMKAHCLSPIA